MYFGIRDRDPGRARNGMVIGIVITVMFLILIMFAIYASQQAIINSGVREQLEEAREQLDAYDPRPEPEPSTTEQETPTPQNPTLDKIIAYDPSLAAMFSDARFNSPNREPSHDEFWIKTEDGVFTQFTLEYMASLIDNQ